MQILLLCHSMSKLDGKGPALGSKKKKICLTLFLYLFWNLGNQNVPVGDDIFNKNGRVDDDGSQV